jgi:hypothetical protein
LLLVTSSGRNRSGLPGLHRDEATLVRAGTADLTG